MSATEERNPVSEDIDILPTSEILRIMNEEDAFVLKAVRAAIPSITTAVDEAAGVVINGGRIFYAGAGTSGRLGVLDASEIPPTFSAPHDLLQPIIAGGDKALRSAVEGAEDDTEAGRDAASSVTDRDFVLGISASGTTPFVLSFLSASKDKGASCWLLTCNETAVSSELRTPNSELRTFTIDGIIKILTGPEIIAGSTRLKAGTATKLALNMFSTVVMIKLGRVYKGWMVDVSPSNKKLIRRAEDIIMQVTGCSREDASGCLRLSEMRTKAAIVMKSKGVTIKEAEKLLKEADGSLRRIIG
ncbi:MAG: N-acetylmuramic acid 6-phosphate etherase [Nitrospirota bacterium]